MHDQDDKGDVGVSGDDAEIAVAEVLSNEISQDFRVLYPEEQWSYFRMLSRKLIETYKTSIGGGAEPACPNCSIKTDMRSLGVKKHYSADLCCRNCGQEYVLIGDVSVSYSTHPVNNDA